MSARIDKVRKMLDRALDEYPSNSEEILKISRLLDTLIYQTYLKVKPGVRQRGKTVKQ